MITKIKLKNFKIFEHEEVSLAPLTVITGINGMGKSSILQSLLLLKQSYEIGYLESRKQIDLTNDFVNLESAEDLCYAGASDDKEVEIAIEAGGASTHIWRMDASNPKEAVLNCTYEGDGRWKEMALFSENFTFLEAERWGPRMIYNKKESRSYNTRLGIQGELTPSYLLNANATNELIGIPALTHPCLAGVEEGDQAPTAPYLLMLDLPSEEEIEGYVGRLRDMTEFLTHENYVGYYDMENVRAFSRLAL